MSSPWRIVARPCRRVNLPRQRPAARRENRPMSHAIEATIRLLGRADAGLLLAADPEVYDKPVDAARTAEFLADPRHHVAVALVEGRVVGSATAVHYVHPDQPPQLFIVEVAVAAAYQRAGLAKRMLQALLDHARALGCTSAWVGTEADNTAARALYRSAGGSLDQDAFVTFSFDLGT
jgi:ribosomal protein S18 acetylase RimI-like enzyme